MIKVNMNKIITVLEPVGNSTKVYDFKYKDIELLKQYDEFEVRMTAGQQNKRIKQLNDLGYELIEILIQGKEKHHDTFITFRRV